MRKCIELNMAVFINVGFPGPRVLAFSQDPMHLDEVCWFFPELRVVMRHGGEPWEDVCVKLMLRWPNLYFATTAFAPKYYPKAIIDYANCAGPTKSFGLDTGRSFHTNGSSRSSRRCS